MKNINLFYLTILSELNEGRMGEGTDGDEKELGERDVSCSFSQWDVETYVCIWMHFGVLSVSENLSAWGSVILKQFKMFYYLF